MPVRKMPSNVPAPDRFSEETPRRHGAFTAARRLTAARAFPTEDRLGGSHAPERLDLPVDETPTR